MKDKIVDEYNKIEMNPTRKAEILDVILEEYDEIKETNTMRKSFKTAIAVAVCALIGIPTVTYAATHFLSAEETATYLGSEELGKLYGDSDIIATMEDGEYRFAYLGNVNAKLEETFLNEGEDASTYVALAIEKIDGTAMEVNETFVASPLIQGLDPSIYNVYSMSGGATWNVKDGVLYMIMNVNNIEIFADKKIYLAITTGPDYMVGYNFDEITGEITRNTDFSGINELFEMNIDSDKADIVAQEQYLENFGTSEDEDVPEITADDPAYYFWNLDYETVDNATLEALENEGSIVASYERKPENGMYNVNYSNEYCDNMGTIDVEDYEIDRIYLSGIYEYDDYVIATYEKRDQNDILYIKLVKYEEEQLKKVAILLSE